MGSPFDRRIGSERRDPYGRHYETDLPLYITWVLPSDSKTGKARN